ncbi:MAG: hydroxymethylbilane synthase [Acidimicrobiales bacterium]
MPFVIRAATRGSTLARWQTDHIASLLGALSGTSTGEQIEVEVVVVETMGDRRQDIPIWEMGGKGVFAKEVQAAVLDGRADIAVHSAKDLPSGSPPGLTIGAVPERGDARDVLVGSTLDGLAPGAVVATGSARRRAQLAWNRPDLTFAELRGNIDTRLAKAAGFGAIVMALAPLERLGLREHVGEVLDPSVMLPQVGQGTLAVECRDGDDRRDVELRALLAAIEHAPSRVSLDAERGFLAELGGDCDLPAGAHATLVGSGGSAEVSVEGLVASLDGHTVIRHTLGGSAAHADAVGRAVARYLLDDAGGAALLDR